MKINLPTQFIGQFKVWLKGIGKIKHYKHYLLICLLSAPNTYASELQVPTNFNELNENYINTAGVTFSSPMDSQFLELRSAARRGDFETVNTLAMGLEGYDMPNYVEYYKLYPYIIDKNGGVRAEFPLEQIRQFLQKYPASPITDKMRTDVLLALGKNKDWGNFFLEYPKLFSRDEVQIECYRLTGLAQRNEQVANLAKEALSVDPKKFGSACVDMLKTLNQKQQLTDYDLQLYALAATEKNLSTLARNIYNAIEPKDNNMGFKGSIAVKDDFLAIASLAQRTPLQAYDELQNKKINLDAYSQALLLGTIAMNLARSLDDYSLTLYKTAFDLVGNLDILTPPSHEWYVRNALKQQNWQEVNKAIKRMSSSIRGKDNHLGFSSNMWDYWYARSLMQLGDANAARNLLAKVAEKNNYYGQLAIEDLGQLISVPENFAVSNQALTQISKRRSLQQAKRLIDMNLREEGRREWNWEIKQMTKDEDIIAAAQLGSQMDLIDRSIYAADQTKFKHNFTLRYPMPLFDVLKTASDTAKADLGFMYGLTRQESRFIKSAKSGVGASGLMQVMPATASWVAKKVGMPWPSNRAEAAAKLADINTNTVLGAHYINMLMQDLDYNFAMTAAGYNAGPGRPKKWRNTFNQAVDGAIFAENIPFTETRDYVKNVLSNAVYYNGLLTKQPQSLKQLLGTITPSGQVLTTLP